MKPRVLAMLLLAGNFAYAPPTHAQQQMMWGSGMYGGMQHCPWPNGPAGGSSSENDELEELKDMQRELKREKREVERSISQMEREKERLRTQIEDVINGSWANVIVNHMDIGYNCCAGSSQPPPYYPEPEPHPIPPPEIPPVDVPPPPSREPRPGTDLRQPGGNRMPASVVRTSDDSEQFMTPINSNRMPAQEVISAGADIRYADAFGADIGAGGGYGDSFGGGGQTLCYGQSRPYTMQAWQQICRNDGFVSSLACTHQYYRRSDVRGAQTSSCSRALDRYRRMVKDIEKAQDRLRRIDDEYENIANAIGDLKYQREFDRDLEADCPSGNCYDRQRRSGTGASSGNRSIMPLIVGTVAGLGAEYLAYKSNKATNRGYNALGWGGIPYAAGQAGYPFLMAGMYGYLGGGVNGAYGCGPTMGGGGYPGGPGGMAGPYGPQYGAYGQINGPFGGMPGQYYPPMGGGMYMPGQGPWGQPGPWGNGGLQAGGYINFPGGNGYGGMPVPGQWPYGQGGMGGGMGGGFPGMGGGMGGGFPGMGGGMGGGFPGMGGGFPGMGGGFPGMGGGFPGMGGGFPGMGGYAGLPTMPGMMPGMMPGTFGGALGDPLGLQYQQQMAQMQLQQYQMAIEMQRRSSDQALAQVRAQQGLMSEYYSLMYRFQQINSGFGSLSSPILGLGTTGSSPIGGSGPTGSTPGRSR